jgi:hypothetical protein
MKNIERRVCSSWLLLVAGVLGAVLVEFPAFAGPSNSSGKFGGSGSHHASTADCGPVTSVPEPSTLLATSVVVGSLGWTCKRKRLK